MLNFNISSVLLMLSSYCFLPSVTGIYRVHIVENAECKVFTVFETSSFIPAYCDYELMITEGVSKLIMLAGL